MKINVMMQHKLPEALLALWCFYGLDWCLVFHLGAFLNISLMKVRQVYLQVSTTKRAPDNNIDNNHHYYYRN